MAVFTDRDEGGAIEQAIKAVFTDRGWVCSLL
jgi:hypothetical protein